MATNRQDTLDPALLRPGRLDRKIEFPNPSRRERRLIFQTVTSKMNLGPDVDLEDCKCLYLTAADNQMYHDRTGSARPKSRLFVRLRDYRVSNIVGKLVCMLTKQRYARTVMLSCLETSKRLGR